MSAHSLFSLQLQLQNLQHTVTCLNSKMLFIFQDHASWFFFLFPARMADTAFLMAVVIYFMSPTGFGMLPVMSPLLKTEEDTSFASAFMSVYMLITLVVYALVVILIA